MRERDEDENLEGAGNLERGKPTSLFFETLRHRKQYLFAGTSSEVRERAPNFVMAAGAKASARLWRWGLVR